MIKIFSNDEGDTISGVAYKNNYVRKKIVSYFAENGNATIADLCKETNLSTPKVTALIVELISSGIVEDFGKVESTGGRKPNIYGLAPDSGFFVGIDVKHNHINIGVIDLQKRPVNMSKNIPFNLNNNQQSFEEFCELINEFINSLDIARDKIFGVGMNLPGRINHQTGQSYNIFNFHKEPLTLVLNEKLGFKTYLENDSRAMAYGELNYGSVTEEKNVLFINVDHGLGMGVIINNELYYGKSGFAGELGHIPLFNNEIICQCGKKGCLETEASGRALVRLFKKKLREGSSSVLETKDIEDIQMEQIIDAAMNDDVLSIDLISSIGEILGREIASIINIFNPELVILGGRLSTTGDYISLPIKSAINKYSLSLATNDTRLKISKLGEDAGLMGACLLARKHLLEST